MINQEKDSGPAVKKIEGFLRILTGPGGLEFSSNILACNGQVQPGSGVNAGANGAVSENTSPSAPDLVVELSGPDTPRLLAHNGELLHAIEHIAARILRFEQEENDKISFDAEGFKAARDQNLQRLADAAIRKVSTTGQPYSFPAMSSRERRMIHLILAQSGLTTASSGMGPRRYVVLYPKGFEQPTASEQEQTKQPSSADRTQAIRNRFRPR